MPVPAPHPQLLVIEDSRFHQQLAYLAFAAEGWHVRSAKNGLEGLKRLTEAIPDLILLDLAMPDMDGFVFLDWLQEIPEAAGVPVIVFTGVAVDADVRNRISGRTVFLLTKHGRSVDELSSRLRSIGTMHGRRHRLHARG